LLRVIERAPDLEGAIVRVFVSLAPEAEGQVRPLELRRALRAAGVAYVAGIKLESEQTARARLPLAPDEDLSPLQMLGLYLEARQVPATRARRLLDLATPLVPEQSDAAQPTALAPPPPPVR
jgi:hypothetical protein